LREFGQLVEQVGFIKSESRPQINEIERICKMATMMLHRLGY